MITLTPSIINKESINLIGKTVRCTSYTSFTDGKEHKVGSLHKVTQETEAYYKLFLNKGYRLVID